MRKRLEAQLPYQLLRCRAAERGSAGEGFQTLLQIFRWALQQKGDWRAAKQKQICQASGSRKHHVDVQPPIAILFDRRARLVTAAVDDDTGLGCDQIQQNLSLV